MNNKKIFFICFQWALVTLFIFFGLYWNMVSNLSSFMDLYTGESLRHVEHFISNIGQ